MYFLALSKNGLPTTVGGAGALPQAPSPLKQNGPGAEHPPPPTGFPVGAAFSRIPALVSRKLCHCAEKNQRNSPGVADLETVISA